MITILKLCLLMVSNFGWWEYFRSRHKVSIYYLPALTIAVQFTLFFLPGLFNFLGEATLAVYLLGLFLFARALWQQKLTLFKPYWNPGYVLFALVLAVVAVTVRGQLMSWIDCFTHWAVVVRNMLISDGFPTFAQETMLFPGYPLGSSASIYYFCRFTSPSEDIQMLAQTYVMASMLLPVFSRVKQQKLLCSLFVAMLANLLLCYNIPVTQLLVDTLLGLAGAAAVLFLRFELCSQEALSASQEEHSKRLLLLGFPMLFWLMNVKASALFFVLLALGLCACAMKGRSLRPIAILGAALAVGYFLWDRHCDYVYIGSDSAQHAVSFSYFSMWLSEKTPQVIWQIVTGVLSHTFGRKEGLCLLAWFAVLGGMGFLLSSADRKTFHRWLLGCGVLYVLYALGLAGMYTVSMSTNDALDFTSIDRYLMTMDVALYVFAAAAACVLLQKLPALPKQLAALVLLFGILTGTWGALGFPLVTKEHSDASDRMRVQSLIEEYGVAPGYSYLICDVEARSGYSFLVCRYLMDSADALQIKVTEPSHMEAEKDYDYILILDEGNPVIENWLLEHYPDQAGERVIQCFK